MQVLASILVIISFISTCAWLRSHDSIQIALDILYDEDKTPDTLRLYSVIRMSFCKEIFLIFAELLWSCGDQNIDP